MNKYDEGYSESNMEILLLSETHNFLVSIINDELYRVSGSPPDQTAMFHTRTTFEMFMIRSHEFFAQGYVRSEVSQLSPNLSLLEGLQWFTKRHPEESNDTGLTEAVANLITWIAKEVSVDFFCSNLRLDISLPLTNKALIGFYANTTKHHLMRLSQLLKKLDRWCVKGSYDFSFEELLLVLPSMIDEAQSRLEYHGTYIVELLARAFFSLNVIVRQRFEKNPTIYMGEVTFPPGTTSEVFKYIYGRLIVSGKPTDERILASTPVTSRWLQGRY